MVKLFISYSHSDERYKDMLEKHLILLKRNKIIEAWSDREIVAGEEWDSKIKDELEQADIILLLVSIDFLNSNYCYDVEIKRAIEKHEKNEAILIPIILRTCDWHGTEFSKIQALPKNGKPVKTFEDEDEAFHSITEGIKLAIERLKNNREISESEIIKSQTKNIIHKQRKECDTPPNNSVWIGRSIEIKDICLDLHKVVFISGIGGQGKSGLASYYVKEIMPKFSQWEFWDWRDCQEKEDRIHTKIISIICRLSNNLITPNQIADERIDDLIELLFQQLNDRRIVFVFDNVDAYIEYENFQLTGAVYKLYKAALTQNHNSKFIFTCRSTVNDIHTDLLIIKLQGLSMMDTDSLFRKYNLPMQEGQLDLLISKSYELTKGHPLWLNLIAAQARRGFDVVEKFISGVKKKSDFQEDDFSSILSNKILNVIWESLNDKQKILLRALAETVRSETHENLSQVLSSELNNNQFNKAFKVLKQLNLIVIKSEVDELDTFELHPLVREYIIQNFGRNERSKFISLFVNFYDNIILILKPKLSSEQPLSFFENWTAKVELAINKDDYKTALVSLEEISHSICKAGFVEEYIRIANLLFTTIDWTNAINEEYSYFHSQLIKFIETITDFGKFDQAKAYLLKYEKQILDKGLNYIRFCRILGHYYWFIGELGEAIKIVEKAISLEEQSDTKSGYDLRHTLALALRDTGEKSKIEKALELFLNDIDIEKVINSKEDLHISGEIYGNVGRCLHYLEKNDDAIKCYKKSLAILSDRMNIGYGYFWIAEALLIKEDLSTSIWFFVQARNIWKKISPIKANMLNKKITAFADINIVYQNIVEMDDIQIEKFCSSWLELPN